MLWCEVGWVLLDPWGIGLFSGPFQLITRERERETSTSLSCYRIVNLCGTLYSHSHICKYAWIVTSLWVNLDLAMTCGESPVRSCTFFYVWAKKSENLRADLAKIFKHTHTLNRNSICREQKLKIKLKSCQGITHTISGRLEVSVTLRSTYVLYIHSTYTLYKVLNAFAW